MANGTVRGRRNRNIGWKLSLESMHGVLIFVLIFLGLFAIGVPAVSPAFGQSSGQWDDEDLDDDFRFFKSKGYLGFRIGRFFPKAEGDLFGMIRNELTLEKSDLRAWIWDIDGGIAMHKRVDLVFSIGYMTRSKNSEFRDWVDENGFPIRQETYYSQLPMTMGVKFLLIPRGRSVGRYVWVQPRAVPFISAGLGTLYYHLGQSGEFVDFETLDIFFAKLETSGWTVTVYAGGGVDIKLSKHTYVTLDLRYVWANPEPGGDFIGFDSLDLDGIRATAGLQWHF